MTIALIYLAMAAGLTFGLWILFLAVMNLDRANMEGKLVGKARVLGTVVLMIGFTVDFLVNVLVMTLLLCEIPKEATVTARLKRHNSGSTGWRLAVAKWFAPLLNPFDPRGDHI
jgi:hypothetical protein